LNTVMEAYSSIKENTIEGRYLHLEHINPLLKKHSENFRIKEIGRSVLGKPIHRVEIGSGSIKILAWSQMHGNESTTTKAIFDLLNAASGLKDDSVLASILSKCTIRIIPMLNPDGARAYTRFNANETDLNRDAKALKEPESRILRKEFDEFQPDFCLNLHDQRTIFSAGKLAQPATLSFLTPSMDTNRKMYPEREKSMQVIVNIFNDLQGVLPGRIGRYDDAYNINCTGDSFQTLGVPTILFEAGHALSDYKREKVREYVFAALVSALNSVTSEKYSGISSSNYLEIPQNEKLFNDIILRNVLIDNQKLDISIQYKEELENETLIFVPIIEKIAPQISNFGHQEIDVINQEIEFPNLPELRENVIVNKIVLNGKILTLKCE
ncbi:MAG TPA: M14 family zinc carboxypeptidase, partial [Salegentibacter sp.]|nr:M14 family zinc carboxypeptidase [Salegentibacter sp.]